MFRPHYLNRAFMKNEGSVLRTPSIFELQAFKQPFIDGCFTVRGRLVQDDHLDADPAANGIFGQTL